MQYYYTYEYSCVHAGDAVFVYRSRDGLIGLKVRHYRHEGQWTEGQSRFFVWANEGDYVDFEWEWQARKSICAGDADAWRLSASPSSPALVGNARSAVLPSVRQMNAG